VTFRAGRRPPGRLRYVPVVWSIHPWPVDAAQVTPGWYWWRLYHTVVHVSRQ